MKGFSSNIDCSDLVSSTTSSLVRGMRFDNQIPVPVDSIFSWGCDPEDILANKFGICDIVVDSTTNGDNKPSSLGINGIEGLLLTVAPSLVQPNNTGSSAGSSSSFAELKPLPFDYRIETSDLLNEENNNSLLVNSNNKTVIDVSLNLFKSGSDNNNNNELFFGDSVTTTVMEGLGSVVQELAQKEEAMGYLTPEIDDIAALIGTAIADSTAQQQQRSEPSQQLPQVPEGPLTERDPWADIDNWIENAFSKNEPSDSDSSEFLSPTPTLSSCSLNPVTSTLHTLLTKGTRNNPEISSIKIEPAIDMPLLHGRLVSGRPDTSKPSISYEFPSCSLARKDSLPHTTFGNHVSTTLPHIDSFSRRQIPKIKDVNIDDFSGEKLSKKNKLKSKMVTSSSPTQSYLESGKEKPLHRCNICNRGFLNKSNIKVHLRTHTGEKPFKCEHCAKAFRQKAHLLKHMQIHKRISRD